MNVILQKKYKELSEQYVEELKKFFIQKGNIFLSELNDSIMDYYKGIHFHLFLFPVVNINSIREKFKDIILPYHQLHNINNEVKKIDLFKECSTINNLLKQNKEEKAREQLITLLNIIKDKNVEINFEPENTIKFFTHLIRMTGLYPYLKKYIENSSFEDQLIYNLFSLDHEKDINGDIVLHREQSKVLKLLLEGKNILLSAPTSFGKSYIIDSLISMKKPKNILIIVPTIALLDETRRRIYKKFHNDYNIITTANESIYFKNIFIFTQERALTYYKVLSNINVDLLIVDEFYKIGFNYSANNYVDIRSSILQQIIFYYCSEMTQKYFIAPNIDEVSENPFIEHNEFYHTDFNTVKLEEHNHIIKNDDYRLQVKLKNDKLNSLLRNELFNKKNIIYTNTVVGIKNNIYKKCIKKYDINIFTNTVLLNDFLKWLELYYSKEWILYKLVKRGIGIHNAQIPKYLSQIQIRLFNDKEISHINTIIATSSLIEGVNTVAENIVLYSNQIASDEFDRFTYNNIKGRAGRMLEYYTGHIYLLEKPPDKQRYKLNIDINDSTIIDIDNTEISNNLTEEQKNNIEETKKEMISMIDEEKFYSIRDEHSIKNDRKTMLNITKELYEASENNNLIDMLLPFSNDDWKNDNKYIFDILNKYNIKYNIYFKEDPLNISKFIVAISNNWNLSLLEILNTTKNYIGIDDYFKFENVVSFDVYNLFSDINTLQKCILKDKAIDISPFVNNLQNVFLPPHVYTLEEFGLPRMLSKIIDESGIIKFNFDEKDGINKTLNKFIEKKDDIIKLFDVNSFDYYFLQYFYDGIDIKI
ncbi:DEAD/DEAH box helicase [Brachyspira pulli]|uniref:DEAD/DEAH box helicase n=1 Tax=Brachyspira pulli TaxID=310721 RepID=UPI003005DED9